MNSDILQFILNLVMTLISIGFVLFMVFLIYLLFIAVLDYLDSII